MVRKLLVIFLPATALAAVVIGCGGGVQPTSQTTCASTAKNATAANEAANADDDLPGLKELDEADRKLAEKQKVCPVSGSPLGTADMGKPYKMTVKGRVIFLCCDGCKDAVEKDPDGILKKVDALIAKK